MPLYISGRDGGLNGDGGVVLRRCYGGVRLNLSRGVRAEVRQRQVDGPHVVDPQQDLYGVDVLETLIGKRLARLLNLLDARRERTHPASCREEREDRCLTACCLKINQKISDIYVFFTFFCAQTLLFHANVKPH